MITLLKVVCSYGNFFSIFLSRNKKLKRKFDNFILLSINKEPLIWNFT